MGVWQSSCARRRCLCLVLAACVDEQVLHHRLYWPQSIILVLYHRFKWSKCPLLPCRWWYRKPLRKGWVHSHLCTSLHLLSFLKWILMTSVVRSMHGRQSMISRISVKKDKCIFLHQLFSPKNCFDYTQTRSTEEKTRTLVREGWVLLFSNRTIAYSSFLEKASPFN